MALLLRRFGWRLLRNSSDIHASGYRFPVSRRGLIHRAEQTVEIPTFPTATHFLEARCQPYLDKKAVIDVKSDKSVTFRELFAQSRDFACGLRERGFRQGDVYLMMAPESIEGAVAILGVMSLGGIYSGINGNHKKDEIIRSVNMVKPSFFHTSVSQADLLQSIQESFQGLKGTIVPDGSLPGAVAFQDVHVHSPTPVSPDDSFDPTQQPAALCFSSGTSGMPKAVRLSPANLISSICSTTTPERWDVQNDDVLLSIFPYFHVGGFVVGLQGCLATGATLAIMPMYELKSYLQAIEKYKASCLGMPPTVARQLVADPLVENFDLSSVRTIISGAAPFRTALQEKINKRFPNTKLHVAYGMTECTCLTHCGMKLPTPVGSVGKVAPNLECKLIDLEDGSPVDPGIEGEVCIRGAPVMLGYLDNPEATKEVIDDEGWYHTGDIGYCDEDGFLFIVDRKKELIKSKAFQVAPAELEDLLLRHEAVADVGVIGISRDDDEHPRAYVVIKPGYDVTDEELMQFVADNSAYYKHLRGGVRFLETIPKLASGKILRRILKDMANEEETADK